MKTTAENANIRITPPSRDEVIQRETFLDEVNAAYAALRNDPKAWKHEQTERAVWENTLADRLKSE